MEDVIVYIIIAIAVVVNVITTYRKEAKKNSQRVLGKPQPTPAETTPVNINKPKKAKQKARPIINHPDSLENKYATEGSYSNTMSSVYDSVNTTTYNEAEEEKAAFQMEEESIEDNNKSNNKGNDLKGLFETKDDLKRAVLYTAILERKY